MSPLFLFLAAVAFVIAIICAAVPTAVLTLGAVGWIAVGGLLVVLDNLFGGVAFPVATTRRRV